MKVGIIGQPTAGQAAAMKLERDQQIKAVEMKKRREVITAIASRYTDHSVLTAYENLTNKELRKKSKEFCFIHKAISSVNFAALAKNPLMLSNAKVRSLSLVLTSISHSKQFSAMNMENPTTDYFDLTMALYEATKAIGANLAKRSIDLKIRQEFTFIASEIGLRIYNMYVDQRQDMY